MTQSIDRIDFLTREVLNHLGDGWIKGVIVRQDINNLVIEARALRDQLSKERENFDKMHRASLATLNELQKERKMRKELVKGLESLLEMLQPFENMEAIGPLESFKMREIESLIAKATELDKK